MWPFSSAKEKENKRLLKLQQLTIQNSPSDRLIMPKEKLMELAVIQADNAARIIRESVEIVQNTKYSDTRSSRLQLLQYHVPVLERFNKQLDNRYEELLRNVHSVLRYYGK